MLRKIFSSLFSFEANEQRIQLAKEKETRWGALRLEPYLVTHFFSLEILIQFRSGENYLLRLLLLFLLRCIREEFLASNQTLNMQKLWCSI